MNRWIGVAVAVLALFIVVPVSAQRGGMGGGVHGGGGGFRGGGMRSGGMAPVGGHVGVAARSGSVSRGFVPINSGFVGHGGVRIRGGVGFGHNPRFHVGFGSGFRNRCFNGFCGGFGSGFFGGVPIVAYPYAYGYPLNYADSYTEFQETSPYTVVQGESSYPAAAAYEQGAMEQQVKDLSGEVERLRAELDARESETARARAAANPRPTVQEVPLSAMLVLCNGRKMQIHNYAIVGQTIWLLDEKVASKISVAQVDLPATKRVNEENGVMFLLPGMR